MPKYRLVTTDGMREFEASPGEDAEKQAALLLAKSGSSKGLLERLTASAHGSVDWEHVKYVYRMRAADDGSS